MPVDELKVERRFVCGMDDVERDAAPVGGLIRLGHDLGLTVVAEGVETAGAPTTSTPSTATSSRAD